MTTQIAIIDPYIKSPAIPCFNGLVELLGLPASYHQPSAFGLQTLERIAPKTSAYIVLGSASHVHENLSWHKPLADFLVSELQQNKPILGCCFGHQLICHALGSTVAYHSPDESKYMGTRLITVTDNFWNFKKGETFELAITHKQVVKKLAPGLMSVGEGLPHDLVIHEHLPFLGTQAHPEASTHFCVTDIQNLKSSEIQTVRHAGDRLILRFFQHFKLL